MTPTMSIARQYHLQDGEINPIVFSDSTITNVVEIDQHGNTISIPRKYLIDVINILTHIQEETI